MSKDKPLKEANTPALIAALAANVVVFHLIAETGALAAADFAALWRSVFKAIPAAAGAALIGVVNALLNADMKARLVFWRWCDPLPGSHAFSRYARRDRRVNLDQLRRAHGPFPRAPREQNALWYGLYRSVRDEPAVVHAHRGYLLARDYAGMSFLLLPTLGALAFWQMPITTAGIYVSVMIAQFLIASLAARNLGCRFVCNVLALKSSGASLGKG